MAATHFLPCPKCQTQATVERRHAGQFVACKNCQHSIEVPKLREFSQLATIESQSAPKSLTIPNPLRPWFFVIGLGSLVLCGIPGGLLYSYSQKMIRYGEDYTETVPPVYFNDLSQEDLWASWYDFFENKRELPPWQASSIKLTYEQGRVLKFVAYGLMGLAAAGLVMLLASFALPDRELKKRKPAGSR